MKRLGNLYGKICSLDNLRLADKKARRGKAGQYGVQVHEKYAESNLLALQRMLMEKSYKTSQYTVFKIWEPKEREIFRLPYFPDRITHHAIMNVLEPVFTSVFTSDTYSCIKGRGIHAAFKSVRQAMKDVPGTQYCLKMDVKKFYPSINHDVLKALIRRKIKDKDVLWLLDEIIDSAPGLPIGNYLSQYLANFYLTYFDHWLKEIKRVRYYFRYADDLVILAGDKPSLQTLLAEIRTYLKDNLKLDVKENYQVFPVGARGLDFVGYRFYHTHTLLRKRIKKRFARMLALRASEKSIAAYYGWACHADTKNLLNKLLMKKFSDIGKKPVTTTFTGDKIKIEKIINRPIVVDDFKIEESKFKDKGNGKCLHLQITVGDSQRVIFTGARALMQQLEDFKRENLPFTTTIIKENDRFEFT